MTITTTTSRIAYTGDGTANPLSFPYPLQAEADLTIIETIIATGVDTTQMLTTDYTVSIAGGGATAAGASWAAPAAAKTKEVARMKAGRRDSMWVAPERVGMDRAGELRPMPAETTSRDAGFRSGRAPWHMWVV